MPGDVGEKMSAYLMRLSETWIKRTLKASSKEAPGNQAASFRFRLIIIKATNYNCVLWHNRQSMRPHWRQAKPRN
jgi:hypothetical protein